MNSLSKLAVLTTLAGASVIANAQDTAVWTRYTHAESGISFELPVQMRPQTVSASGGYKTIDAGDQVMPYIFVASFATPKEKLNLKPEAVVRTMATLWKNGPDPVNEPDVRLLKLKGIDDAWMACADVRKPAGTLTMVWISMEKDGKLYSLGLTYWAAEKLGMEACARVMLSISAPEKK